MLVHLRFLFLALFFPGTLLYAQNLSLSGKVGHENGTLRGATVSLQNGWMEAMTDTAGFFRFANLPEGNYKVTVSFTGYRTYHTTVLLRSTSLVLPTIVLRPQVHQLQGVTIVENAIGRRKRESALTLDVVNQEFLKRNLGGSLMQSLERLPGVQTIGIGSGQSKPLIRGLGFNRVVVVEKGIKHEGQQWGADHGLEIDQFTAAEVELLKGAASFMYGSDAIAGVIDVKPAPVPPKDAFGGSVDLIGKSNNGLYGSSINLFRRKDRWFADARFTYQHYGDFRVPTDTVFVYDYAVGLHRNFLRNTAGRETGLHLHTGYVADRFRSIVYASHVYSRSGFFANAHGLEPRRVDTKLHDASNRDIQMPSQEVSHLKLISRTAYAVGNHRLELDLGFQHNFRQEFSHYVNHGYMPPTYPDTLAVSPMLEREFDKQVYSLNFRDAISFGRHTLTAGLGSEYQDNGISGWSFLVPAFRQLTAGAFLYDKYQLNDQVILHGALRYDYGHIQTTPYTDWFPSQRTTDGQTVSEKLLRADELTRRFNSLVWSVGINYNPNKFALKANIGKSFRMPIAKELAANGVNYHYFSYEKGRPDLSPEQSYQADASLSWEENKWFVQLNPFYNYFPNYIYLNPTPNHDYFYGAGNQVFAYTQSRVMRYGGEVQVRYQVARTLSTEVLAEYLYARQLSGDKRGFTLPFSPPPSLLLNLTWSPVINEQFQHNYLSLDFRLVAKQHNIVPPEKKTPGYGVLNLQAGTGVGWGQQTVRVNFQVQNLLNTRYLNHTSFYRLIGMPEAGRNFILTVKIPFTIQLTNTKK